LAYIETSKVNAKFSSADVEPSNFYAERSSNYEQLLFRTGFGKPKTQTWLEVES
jgi:hypothetical protein